ncbi:MAG: DNA-methyltransferase [Spirochaetota bacterium]
MFATNHKLIFGPAAKLSSEIDDASVRLVVTSPPYPMIEMWDATFASQSADVSEALAAGEGRRAFEAMHRVLDEVWTECYRVLTPGGFACINIGDATRSVAGRFKLYSNHTRITAACEGLGFEAVPLVLWRKQTNAPNKFMGSGMLPGGAYVTLEHEYILMLRKGGKAAFGPQERSRRRESAIFWEERNHWFSDLWDFKGVRQHIEDGARARSGAFPFELAYRLINMYSLRGDTVFDPFLGTGTTTAAALAAARNSIGVEVDSDLREEIFGVIAGLSEVMNARVWERLAEHNRFLESRRTDGKPPLKHKNERYGFPVMTTQETELTLSSVDTIERTGADTVGATHRDLSARDVAAGDPGAPAPGAPAPPMLWGFPDAE